MQTTTKCGTIEVKSGWLTCPVCHRNKKLLRIDQSTEARGLPVFCRDCKHESILDISRGQRVELRSP